MPREPTTPHLVTAVRSFAESAPNDLEAFLGHLADNDIDAARAAAERLAEERGG
ncbi:MAG TPA: hypothetical protein VMK12_21250 [Anaeromyxobacteraceae bacterium]|nr:hypothetical protein [Anaeromyxobacteraceae bacterium]